MKDMPEPCSDVAGRLILEWQVRAPTELYRPPLRRPSL